MKPIDQQRRGEESDDDLLWAMSSVERSLASMRAEQFEYVRDFVLRYANDAGVVALAGRERMVRFGGAGTPAVPEFAVAQVQAELGHSTWAAQRLVADAMSLIYRLPGVFAALWAGEVDERRARMAASATRELSLAQVAEVDARLAATRSGGTRAGAAPVVARMSRKRLEEVIDQVTAAVDPDGVEDEVAAALAARDVGIRPGARGTCDLSGSLSSADGARLRDRLGQVVGWLVELGDTRARSVLRSVALGMLADPGTIDRLYARVHAHRTGDDPGNDAGDDHGAEAAHPHTPDPAPVPATMLYVHVDRASGTWSLDGSGPLTRAEAADLVGGSNVTIRPVIDLAEDLSYTGYIAPPRLKEQLRLHNAGRCAFPSSCEKPAWCGDYDHNANYDPNAPPGQPGSTSSANGALLCRFHHRAKTHTNWTVESPTPGTWLWHSPSGDHHLVTAGTTTRLHT